MEDPYSNMLSFGFRKACCKISDANEKQHRSYSQEMSEALLAIGDFNVIAVDWGGGSASLYSQSAANTRLVGLEVAFLINFLKVGSVILTTRKRIDDWSNKNGDNFIRYF